MPRPTPSAAAGPSSRKRAAPVQEDDFENDPDMEQFKRDLDFDEEDGEDDEEFEIDTGSEDGDVEDFEEEESEEEEVEVAPVKGKAPVRGGGRAAKPSMAEVSDDSNDEQDSQADLDSDEEGYNSSDIDAMSSPSPSSPSSLPSQSNTDLTLDELIAKHTSKPAEEVPYHSGRYSKAKEGEGRLVPSKLVKGGYLREYDEYEAGYGSESSTEDNPNTIGNVPPEWYDDLPHIGYTVDGKKILRPAKGDELDRFLESVEDPDSWTTALDASNQRNVSLSASELDIIHRLQRGENPDKDFDPYQPTIEWFTGKGMEMVMPLSGAPERKGRFVPSKWEHKKVMKIVKAIREGRIVPNKPPPPKASVYAIWSSADQESAAQSHAMYMPAPQLPPPKTIESYNPPEEYLFDQDEKAAWDAQDKEDRKTNFEPKKYAALRSVPGYDGLVQERFERCLDLYLAPRVRKTRLNINPESLIPKLPSPKELKPFPTTSSVTYRHPASSRVRAVSVSPGGEWVASGSEDGVVRVWDLGNGREVWRWRLTGGGAVQAVEWNPNKEECMIAAVCTGRIYLLAPLALTSPQIATHTLTHLTTGFSSSSASAPSTSGGPKAAPDSKWIRPSESERDRGVAVLIEVQGTVKQVTWHRKGDYFATVAVDASNKSVLIHQLSKHQSQSPFKKMKGSVQRVAFHPHKPHFFVATQRYIRLYDLAGQKLIKTLMPGLKWISSMDIHPMGDNLIVGSYDKKLCWFDMDLSTKPFKTLRYHTKALRSVAYHPTYPLFASSSDDGTIHVFHGTVYSDLMQNPLIVPLKVLKGHGVKDGLGVLDMRWHPTKPWLVSSGADGEVRLWCS